jgi:hypothetical protein
MTPNAMPRKGSPITTVTRERTTRCSASYGTYTCCYDTHTVKVPALKRGPRTIRNTALADALANFKLNG